MDWLTKLDLNKKIGISYTIIYAVVFAILPDEYKIPWCFTIIPAIFYFSTKLVSILPVLFCVGIILPFFKAKEYLTYILQYDIFILLSLFFAYRFYYSFSEIDEKFLPGIKRLKNQLDLAIKNKEELKNKRDKMKSNLEKITELFRLCKEIAEHLDIKDMMSEFSRIIISERKVKSFCFFQIDEKNSIDTQTLFFSNIDETSIWLEIIKTRQDLFHSKEPTKFVNLKYFPFDVIVFYPVYLELLLGYFMFRIDMTAEKESMEELMPFLVQISLALKRSKLYLEVEKMSRRDGLTGLYLRRYFLERFDEELVRAKRYNNRFAIFMVDIDYFKKVNDTYGHSVGDFVLEKLADKLVENVHKGDLIARYGGEEFIIYLPHTSRKEALLIAEQIRSSVESENFVLGDKCVNITISIGVAYYPENGLTKEEIISASDKALYLAKQLGRNRVTEFKQL
jgi:diguanylate cyclase (GGDEF)-like protein